MSFFKEKTYSGHIGILSAISADIAITFSSGPASKNRIPPDFEIIDALIGIFKNEATPEDDRSWAKNGLQTIRNKADSEGYTDLVSKINLIVGK